MNFKKTIIVFMLFFSNQLIKGSEEPRNQKWKKAGDALVLNFFSYDRFPREVNNLYLNGKPITSILEKEVKNIENQINDNKVSFEEDNDFDIFEVVIVKRSNGKYYYGVISDYRDKVDLTDGKQIGRNFKVSLDRQGTSKDMPTKLIGKLIPPQIAKFKKITPAIRKKILQKMKERKQEEEEDYEIL